MENFLSNQAQILFSNRAELKNAVLHLMQKYDDEVKSVHSHHRMKNLGTVITSLASAIYDHRIPIKTHVFGSRVTGLATEKSDVDIYLQIGE